MSPLALAQALLELKKGELVIIPTETVYGLAGDMTQEKTVRLVFQLKNRPYQYPLIIHGAEIEALYSCSRFLLPEARQLAEAFWPGPLTLIVPKASWVSPLITAGQDSVAIRMPNHPLSLQLLHLFGKTHSGLVVAPSANRFGHTSPTQPKHLIHEFQESPFILDGGPCSIGIESTIIDARTPDLKILRPGIISSETIQKKTGLIVKKKPSDPISLSPGGSPQHYSPYCPLYLGSYEKHCMRIDHYPNQIWAVFSFKECPKKYTHYPLHWNVMPQSSALYGQMIYDQMRKYENSHSILVECPPENSLEWQAIRDRLKRASINQNDSI